MNEVPYKWVCPFCVTSWICDGPHIEEKDSRSFLEYAHYAKEDHAYACLDEIEKYEKENKINLNDLKMSIMKKVMERDR